MSNQKEDRPPITGKLLVTIAAILAVVTVLSLVASGTMAEAQEALPTVDDLVEVTEPEAPVVDTPEAGPELGWWEGVSLAVSGDHEELKALLAKEIRAELAANIAQVEADKAALNTQRAGLATMHEQLTLTANELRSREERLAGALACLLPLASEFSNPETDG